MDNSGLPEDIERLLSCPVCLDVFTQPVVILPCQHNLCRKCAEDCYDRRGRVVGLSGGKFQCPTCRYEVMVDRHGVYSLPRNLLVENLIEMYATQIAKKQQAPPEPPKPEPVREPTPPPANRVPLCEDHEDERINVFCLSCQKPTCSMCKVFGKHQNCDVIPIKKAYDDQKNELREHMARLGSGIEQIQTVQADTDHLRQSVEAASKRAKQEVNQAFQQLCALLEKRKTAMIARIQEDVNERIGILSDMSTSYKKQRDEIQKVMNDGLKLTEEQEATVFLTKSRTMINKVVNQARAMTEIRPPQSIVPELKPYKIDFARYHQICSQIDFDNGQRPAQRPDSARSRLPSNHSNSDLSCIPGLARPPPIPAPTDDELSNFRAMADALKQAEDGSGKPNNSSSKSIIQKEDPIVSNPSAIRNISKVAPIEAQKPVEEQESAKSNEDEYTYEEVEVEELVTDSEGEDNEEPPSTAPISEHPITETDDQIPDYVLESSQASRISLPQPQQNEDERASVDSGAVQEAIEASIEAINEAHRDGNQSSRADMADDENTESDSASTEYEEIEIEVTDSEYESESNPESEASDFQSAKSKLEESQANDLRKDSEEQDSANKDATDSTSDSNSKPSIIYHPAQNDVRSESSGEYEEIELEIEVTDSEASESEDAAQLEDEESNDVSLASVSLCHDTSKDEASDEEFPQSAPAPKASAPISISMSKASSTSNLASSSPRLRGWLSSASPGRLDGDIFEKRVHPVKTRKRTNTGP